MAASAFFAALHHLLFFLITAALVAEFVLLAEPPAGRTARRLALIDAHYGAAALSILAIGFIRAVYYEKGWDYYAANHFFHLKIGVFILVALVSVYPTLQFIRWRKAGAPPAASAVARVRRFLMAELAGLAFIFVAAALMARDIGS